MNSIAMRLSLDPVFVQHAVGRTIPAGNGKRAVRLAFRSACITITLAARPSSLLWSTPYMHNHAEPRRRCNQIAPQQAELFADFTRATVRCSRAGADTTTTFAQAMLAPGRDRRGSTVYALFATSATAMDDLSLAASTLSGKVYPVAGAGVGAPDAPD
jgi:hypothetical protein